MKICPTFTAIPFVVALTVPFAAITAGATIQDTANRSANQETQQQSTGNTGGLEEAGQETDKKQQGEASSAGKEEIVYEKDEAGWFKIPVPEGQAELRMPAEPRQLTREIFPLSGPPIEVHFSLAQDEANREFVFGWFNQDLARDADTVNRTLDGAVKGAMERTLGDLESIKSKLTGKGRMPTVEYQIKFVKDGKPMRLSGQVILFQGIMYQLTAVSLEETYSEEIVRRFFDTFLHIPPPSSESRSPGESD